MPVTVIPVPGEQAPQIGRRARAVKVESDRLPSYARCRGARAGLWREGGPVDGLENRRRFAIARCLAKRGLVAFLAFAMAFGTTPTQMWADGVEGIAEAATETADANMSASDDAVNDTADSTASANEKAAVEDNAAPVASTDKKSVDTGSNVEVQAQKISVSLSVIGRDASGNPENWLTETKYELDAGASFGDLLGDVNDNSDLDIAYIGPWASVSRGETELENNKGAAWVVYVNGKKSDVIFDNLKLNSGDSIVWKYEEAPKEATASVSVIGVKDVSAITPLSDTWINGSEQTFNQASGATAWDLFKSAFEQSGITYKATEENWGIFLDSVTSPSGVVMGTPSDYSWYWGFYVNGKSSDVGVGSYQVQPGDKLELVYLHNSDRPIVGPDVDANAEHPDLDSDWGGFSNGGKGSLTDALTPTVSTTNPSWTASLLSDADRAAGKSASASDPLIVGNKLFVVTGTSFYDPDNGWALTQGLAHMLKIDLSTGKIEADIQLGTTMDSTCRPVYADGIIVVPLSKGCLQAVSASSLKTIWFTGACSKQSLSSLTVHDGFVYLATLDAFGEKEHSSDVQSGSVRRYNLYTGMTGGSVSSNDGGYYWSGGVVANGYYVIGADGGRLSVYSSDLSEEKSSLSLGVNIRSALVENDGYVYAVTRDNGTLHKFTVDAYGTISEVGSVQFAPYSTSTPTFADGYAFVGGATAPGFGGKGILSVINLSEMAAQQILDADGKALIAESKSTPLVSVQNGQTYVYFTCNGAEGPWTGYTSGGGIYMYRLGDKEATELFIPGEGFAQYCMASVICDAAGNLYYTNDSGNLFCIKATSVKVKLSTGETATCALGSKLAKPADPTRTGYTFGGWFTDAACTKAYDFSKTVTEAFTLYAKWTKVASEPVVKPGSKPTATTKLQGKVAPVNKSIANVAPSSKPVAKKQTTLNASDDKGVSSKAASSEKTSSSKKVTSPTKSASAKAAKAAGSVDTQNSSMNPLAIVGVVAGVIGLILIVVFLSKKRGGEE